MINPPPIGGDYTDSGRGDLKRGTGSVTATSAGLPNQPAIGVPRQPPVLHSLLAGNQEPVYVYDSAAYAFLGFVCFSRPFFNALFEKF